MGVVSVYAEEAVVMRARERLESIGDMAAATGHMGKGNFRAHINTLERATRARELRPDVPRPRPVAAGNSLADLAALGVGVRVTRKGQNSTGAAGHG